MKSASFMIFKAIIVLVYCTLCFESYSQSDDSINYQFSSDIYNAITKDSAYWKSGGSSGELSFIGLYKQALTEYDKPRKAEIPVPLSATDSLNFVTNYHPADVRSFIRKVAKQNQIIIFNEAHYNPRNRVFVASMLPELKKAGFTFLLAETFVNDSSFFKEKHPIFSTGYYTAEPQFGNLVREAEQLGYHLYPYEYTDTIYTGYAREMGEAKNIKRILDQYPKAKIIIYCGYSHILEDDSIPGWGKAMAGRLRELTNINPYTFDQIKLSERQDTALENPYYKLIHANRYAVLLNNKGEPFHNRSVDALIYLPRTNYLYNRPSWVFENGRRPYFIKSNQITIAFPVMVKVYLQTDNIRENIPIDIIEISSQRDVSTTAISLPKQGHFIIVVINQKGDRQIVNLPN